MGIIGSRIAQVLREKNCHVVVWNRTPRAEPNFLGTLRELAEQSKFIQIFVRDGAALLKVVDDLLPHLSSQHIVANHSTVSPAETKQAQEKLSTRGIAFLDAPFTGSKNAAAAGKLVYYVGGNEAVLEKARTVLEKSGKVLYLGTCGVASTIKVATNLVSAAVVAALAEALDVVRAEGVDESIFSQAMEANANRSALTDMKLATLAADDFEAHFSIKNMLKDMEIASAMMTNLPGRKSLPLLAAVVDKLRSASQQGKNDLDYSVLLQRAEDIGYSRKEEPSKS